MKKFVLIGGGAGLLFLSIVFGAVFAGPMLASANNQTPAAGTPTAKTNKYCDQYIQDLAKRLNVSVETLRQDSLSAREDVLAQKVKDGKLTQQQADAIKQRLASQQACAAHGKRPGNFKNILLKKYLSDFEGQVATGLHMNTAQLVTQLKANKSLNQIATTQHVAAAQLHTIVLNALQSELKKAVSAGDLTQKQANTYNQFLQKHPQALDKLLNAHWSKRLANSNNQ